MKKPSFRQLLRAVANYAVFFLVVSFAVTCCMLLFISTLADSMGLVFTADNIALAAKLTFGNVVLITLIFSTIDYLRRKFMVDRPVRLITQTAEKITRGEFDLQLEPLKGIPEESGFQQILECLNKMAKELSGTETLRTDFIANVSHELRTPLAVMGNYATMLQKPDLPQQERLQYAKAISDASHRLAQLVSNILKLNKLENQQIFPQTVEFDLTEQLCQCLLQFEDAWEERQLQTQLEEKLLLRSDPELLALVWSNLISNAVKFTPAGGTVFLGLQGTDEEVCVTVRDTGCGMTPETGKHIFEKFYQADPSHATQGNGLGLALVKQVVDILGGRIEVESIPGKGSTFTVTVRRR